MNLCMKMNITIIIDITIFFTFVGKWSLKARGLTVFHVFFSLFSLSCSLSRSALVSIARIYSIWVFIANTIKAQLFYSFIFTALVFAFVLIQLLSISSSHEVADNSCFLLFFFDFISIVFFLILISLLHSHAMRFSLHLPSCCTLSESAFNREDACIYYYVFCSFRMLYDTTSLCIPFVFAFAFRAKQCPIHSRLHRCFAMSLFEYAKTASIAEKTVALTTKNYASAIIYKTLSFANNN